MPILIPTAEDFAEKRRRFIKFLSANGYSAAIIGRRENLLWFTCGDTGLIRHSTGHSATLIVITQEHSYLLACEPDELAIPVEAATFMGLEPVWRKPGEGNLEEKAWKLTDGAHVVSDIPLANADCLQHQMFQKLHFPLTSLEIDRLRWICEKTDKILWSAACEIRQKGGVTDTIAQLKAGFASEGIAAEASLGADDGRRGNVDKPAPANGAKDHWLGLSVAVEKWGLHAEMSRIICFGSRIPQGMMDSFDAVCRVQASVASMCIPGERLGRIVSVQQNLLADLGYGSEGEAGLCGGMTGYLPAGGYDFVDSATRLAINQAYGWSTTIAGAHCGETVLSTRYGIEIASARGHWPAKEYSYNGRTFRIPQIFLL